MRYRLRSLLLVMLLVCAVLAFGRWLVTAKYYTVVESYPDGTPMHRFSLARDWRGQVFFTGKQVSYYPNGSPCLEYTVKLHPRDRASTSFIYNGRAPKYLTWPNRDVAPLTWYLPDGVSCSQLQFLAYVHQRKLEVDEEVLTALARPGKKLLWLNDKTVQSGDTELGFMNLPDGDAHTIAMSSFTKGIGYDPVEQSFYATPQFSMIEYNLSRKTLTPRGGGFIMHGPVIDHVDRRMYWAEHHGDLIARANLDGTMRETVIHTKPHPSNVALDLTNRKLYFSAGSQIHRANLDGSSVKALNRGNVNGIAVDAEGGRIYWTDRSTGRVMTAALDGRDEKRVIYKDTPEGICLDLQEHHIYFSAEHPSKIFRCDFDGKNLQVIRVPDSVNTLKLVTMDEPAAGETEDAQ